MSLSDMSGCAGVDDTEAPPTDRGSGKGSWASDEMEGSKEDVPSATTVSRIQERQKPVIGFYPMSRTTYQQHSLLLYHTRC